MEGKWSRESPRGGHKPGRRAQGGRVRPTGLSLPRALFGLFIIFLIFKIFQNRHKVLLWNFWSRFTYRTTYLPLFQGSGALQKVSLMCSSGVIVWIILVSTLMGVPGI